MPRHPARMFSVVASRRGASQHLYWVGTAITAVALASSLAIVSPAAAAPAAPNITILSVGPDSNGNPYNLTVAASDTNPGVTQITSMTAHVYSASMQDVADPTMTFVSGPPTDQVWVANPPITESALPAGSYTVTVDASDGTESDPGLAAGSFSFAYATSSLAVTAAPPSVTQGSQGVTFSGTLMGTAPGGGTPVGIANAPVNLSGAASNPVATTNSAGFFSYAATGVQPGSYSFSVAATSTYPAPTPASASVTAQQAATSMIVAASPATVTEGEQAVTFSGSVSVTPAPPATQTAVGIGIGIPIYLNGSSTPVTQTTDANGDFSYTATGVQPGTYTFSVNQSTIGLYSSASKTASVGAQAAPTTISVTPSPVVLTFGSQSASFTGTVTALPQGATTAVPVQGAQVYLSIGGATPVPIGSPTDASGHFTYSASGITGDTTYDFSVAATSIYSAASEDVPVNVDPGVTSISVTAIPPDINLASSTVVFTGTVSVTPFGSTTATGIGAGIPVYLNGSASPVATTNDSNGDFTYTVHHVATAADYDFTVDSSTWYTAGSDSVPIGQNQVNSALTVTANPVSVTEGAQTVTFSGTLTGVSPGGSTAVAIQNAPVDVSVDGGTPPAQIKTTDVNGDFTYTASGISQKTTYAFSVGSTTTYTQATDDMTVGVNQAQTRITGIAVTPAHLKYGQTATLRGTVQYLSGTTWTALPGMAVHLAEGKTRVKTATTARDGAFSATLPSTHGPGWTATVNTGRLTLQTSVMGNLSIALPLTVKSFTASLGTDYKVSATGCVEVTAPTGPAPQTSVSIQYSARGHSPWKSLGTLPLDSKSRKYRPCPGADESYFSGALQAKLANAYYRVVFPATYSFRATVSKVVHAWKYQTRIVKFRISPHKVSTGRVVTIKGQLEVLGKSWRAFPRQNVYITYNDKGTSYWQTLGSAPTNSKGNFEFQVKGGKGNFVSITYGEYHGDAKHLACSSPGIDVVNNNGSSEALAAAPNLPELLKLINAPELPVPLVPTFQLPGASISDLLSR